MKSVKMMFYGFSFFCLFICSAFSENCVIPFKYQDEVILFEADRCSINSLVNYSAKWEKKGNLIPQLSTVESNKSNWIQFSYGGSEGKGVTRLDIAPERLPEMAATGKEFCGIKLLINYDGVEFEKIEIKAVFEKNSDFIVYLLPLEKGVKEYSLTQGWKKTEFPADWTKLKYLWISSENANMRFMLKKISMISKKAQAEIVPLKISSVKKVHEVLLSQNPVLLEDGTINENCLDNALPLQGFCTLEGRQMIESKNSPVKAKVAYDEKYLCIGTEAEFPDEPVANVKKRDNDAVCLDEAVEYFFSPWNDNNRIIQFVTNYHGTVFDSLRDYDPVAAGIIDLIQWDLPHSKKISYENGIWKTVFAASVKDLKMDLNKYRFIGFQLAQNYRRTNNSEKYKTLSWTSTLKFPDPLCFGILVFNKKPFGKGELEIKAIHSRQKTDDSSHEILIKISGRNFAEGEYKLETIIVSPDSTEIRNTVKMKLFQEEKENVLKIGSAKNINGNCTVYVCIYNGNNDIRMSAVNFENVTPLKEMFGANIFCPTPKKVIWGEGVFMAGKADKILISGNATERTVKTAGIFKDKLCGFTASQYSITTAGSGGNAIVLKISNNVEFGGEKVELRKDGYCINVKPEGVNITGGDEAGLYYGCITFLQLLKMPMKIVDGTPVKSVNILDWPDIPNRMVRIEHPWQFKNNQFNENPKIEYLMDWVERFAAENKFNRLWLDISMLIKFKRQPEFNGTERVFSIEDLEKFGNFCRDHFIEIIPSLQIGSHTDWWLLGYHPELKEKGYPSQADITHPEHNKIVYNCILDMVEAMKPKYFSPKSDEYWGKRNITETPDEFLKNGRDRANAFLDFHIELNNWLKARNIKMIIFEDMLNPRHNGKRYDVYKVIDKFPRDIIIAQWGIMPDLTAEYFIDKGFEVWGNPTVYWAYGSKVKSKVKGMGFSAYTMGTDWQLFRDDSSFSVFEIFMGANNAWNILRKEEPSIMEEIASGKLAALREMFALQANPAASPKVATIDIQKYMDCDFTSFLSKKGQECILPEGIQDIGNIPMMFSNQKMNCILLGKEKTLSIPVGNSCSSLIFLHAISVSDKSSKEFNEKPYWRKWPYGYITGNYQVHYNDGTVRQLPVRLFWNIGLVNTNPLYRATNDNRYIMPLKVSDGCYKFLYQWEWVNPFPEKKIEKITYADNGEFKFDIILASISCRDRK